MLMNLFLLQRFLGSASTSRESGCCEILAFVSFLCDDDRRRPGGSSRWAPSRSLFRRTSHVQYEVARSIYARATCWLL